MKFWPPSMHSRNWPLPRLPGPLRDNWIRLIQDDDFVVRPIFELGDLLPEASIIQDGLDPGRVFGKRELAGHRPVRHQRRVNRIEHGPPE